MVDTFAAQRNGIKTGDERRLQIIDATLVPAPTQHSTRGERELIDQSTMPPTGAIRLPIAKPG